MNMTALSDRVTAARTAAGMRKIRLAEAVGVKPATVTGWESGKIKKIEAENLHRLSTVLGVSVDWLMNGDGQFPSEKPPETAAPAAETLPPERDPADEITLLELFRRLTNDQRRAVILKLSEIKEQNDRLITELLSLRTH